MNNNNLDQVTMRSSKRKRSKIPMKFSVDTSMGIGEVQPLMFQKVLANSKKRFKVGNVVRLAPMVAPTFGQMKLHHNVSFVGMSDLINSEVYNAYQVGEPVSFNGASRIPQYLPSMTLQMLSAFALVGAKWTVYLVSNNADDSSDDSSIVAYNYEPAGASAPYSGHLTKPRWVGTSTNSAEGFLCNIGDFAYTNISQTDLENVLYVSNQLWMADGSSTPLAGMGGPFENYNGPMINLGRIFGWEQDVGLANRNGELWIPCANFEMSTFLNPSGHADVDAFIRQDPRYKPGLMDLEPVSYENYDFLIRVSLPLTASPAGNRQVQFAVRLSDFGRRWFNIMNAVGFGFDLQSTKLCDVTRIFALYKSWFDSFGMTLYQGWETTAVARLLSMYNSEYWYDYSAFVSSFNPADGSEAERNYRILFAALRDVCDMWYTEEQDFVTAHSRQAAVSPDVNIINEFGQSGTPNVNNWGLNINQGSAINEEVSIHSQWNSSTGGHAYITQVLHSQLDSEVLKRLYKVTNRNTIAGRRIADLLKAQGLGQYVKQCRSNFIGHSAVDIEIFDVTSTADSFNSKDDVSSILGEYVGKGVGEGNSKWFSYDTPEVGYIIDLGAIVPESGWMNSVDLTSFDVRSGQQYFPEYDGLGLEISPKSVVTGVQDSYSLVANAPDSVNGQSYGFIPRYTRYKVARNVANGSFALRSVRRSFLPYNIDKFVDVGNRVLKFDWISESNYNYSSNTESKLLTPSRVPISSPMYRYLGRFPWMSQFNRIFANIGRDAANEQPYWYQDYNSSVGDSEISWFITRTDDPFNVHNVYLMDYFAPVLPIEDSFETHEDGNNGPTDLAMGKA